MMIDFLNESEFTMTQIHTEIDKAKELYHTLSGSIYSAVLYDEIRWAYRLLNSRKYIASEQERECYDTFRKYGLLKEL